ncbi:MAG: glucosyltransferase domain-containing protein, partial [Ruminococcus sp.]|nr:glucosyltransferase domain-containing protein [Candidatus Copronaster equi]
MKAVLKSSDNNLLVKIKNDFLKYLNDKFYMLFLLITALGSYGFLITHYSVSIDDLEYDRYYYGELIAQGRLSSTIIHRLFNLTDNIIYIQDFLGLVFMCIGIILLCTFLDKYLKTKNHIPQIFFSCVFLSFPLHSELFSYGGCFFAIGSECVLMSISLLLVKEYLETQKISCWILSIIPLFVIASWYESMLIVYVC